MKLATEPYAEQIRRCDPGVIKALQVLLAVKDADTLPLEASLALVDPVFYSALATLADAWAREGVPMNVAQTLEEALEACRQHRWKMVEVQ